MEKKDKAKAAKPASRLNGREFNVRIDRMYSKEDEDEIEEEIQTDRDDQIHAARNVENGLTESGGGYGTGITVSQSLGVDPSVDSLALDEYDHIEFIN